MFDVALFCSAHKNVTAMPRKQARADPANDGMAGLRPGPFVYRLASECFRTGFGDGLILLSQPTADAHRTHYLIPSFERHAASEDHDATVV